MLMESVVIGTLQTGIPLASKTRPAEEFNIRVPMMVEVANTALLAAHGAQIFESHLHGAQS